MKVENSHAVPVVASYIAQWLERATTLLLLLFASTKFCDFGIPTISRSRAKFCDFAQPKVKGSTLKPTVIIGNAEAFPILCVRYIR